MALAARNNAKYRSSSTFVKTDATVAMSLFYPHWLLPTFALNADFIELANDLDSPRAKLTTGQSDALRRSNGSQKCRNIRLSSKMLSKQSSMQLYFLFARPLELVSYQADGCESGGLSDFWHIQCMNHHECGNISARCRNFKDP
jgi:hypothetical protein